VRAAAYELAGWATSSDSSAVPIIVVLRKYARAWKQNRNLSFLDYIYETIDADYTGVLSLASVTYLLSTGRAAVFFDGLDEVLAVADRREITQRIDRFARRFGLSSMAVTSRSVGYDQAPVNRTFFGYLLDTFQEDEIRAFARNVLRVVQRKEVALEEDVEKFFLDSQTISDIRSNPLMLGILCFLYAAGRTLPRDRLDLYSRCAELLFVTWDDERDIVLELEDPDAAQQAVREVALKVFRSGEEEVAQSYIEGIIKDFYAENAYITPTFRGIYFAKAVFEAWKGRKWILSFAGEKDGEDYYRFSHRTFLEFFAAEQIAYEATTGQDAWTQISRFVTTGSATPFCQIVVQLMDRKTKGTGSAIMRLALEEATNLDMKSENDRIKASSSGLRSDNCTIFVASTLASVRTTDDFRVEAIQACGRSMYQLFRPGSLDMRTHVERHVIPGMLLGLVAGFENFSPDERQRLLGFLVGQVWEGIQDTHEDPDPWLQVAYCLYQMQHLMDWPTKNTTWTTQVEGLIGQLWSRLVADEVYLTRKSHHHSYHALRLALLQNQPTLRNRSVISFNLHDLFIGVWPLVPHVKGGTLGHSVYMAINGHESDDLRLRWSVEEVQIICAHIAERVEDGDTVGNFSTERPFGALDPKGLRRVRERLVSPEAVTSQEFLGFWFNRLGDVNFLTASRLVG
jgi:hypothetical protein